VFAVTDCGTQVLRVWGLEQQPLRLQIILLSMELETLLIVICATAAICALVGNLPVSVEEIMVWRKVGNILTREIREERITRREPGEIMAVLSIVVI